jgi:glutaredoxin-related protein
MQITFFKSRFCPRCAIARHYLYKLAENDPTLDIHEIDVLLHPLQTFQQKIRMIPAIKKEQRILSGLILTQQQIDAFLNAEKTEDALHTYF